MRNRGQRLQIPGRCDQKVCMEPTERVVTPGWHETFQRDSCLIADIHHQAIKRIAILLPGRFGNTTEEGNRLEMNTSDTRCKRRGQFNQPSQIIVIYSLYNRRYQGNTNAKI